jgi:hypothetical protein
MVYFVYNLKHSFHNKLLMKLGGRGLTCVVHSGSCKQTPRLSYWQAHGVLIPQNYKLLLLLLYRWRRPVLEYRTSRIAWQVFRAILSVVFYIALQKYVGSAFTVHEINVSHLLYGVTPILSGNYGDMERVSQFAGWRHSAVIRALNMLDVISNIFCKSDLYDLFPVCVCLCVSLNISFWIPQTNLYGDKYILSPPKRLTSQILPMILHVCMFPPIFAEHQNVAAAWIYTHNRRNVGLVVVCAVSVTLKQIGEQLFPELLFVVRYSLMCDFGVKRRNCSCA